jgi:hypothetical protein
MVAERPNKSTLVMIEKLLKISKVAVMDPKLVGFSE